MIGIGKKGILSLLLVLALIQPQNGVHAAEADGDGQHNYPLASLNDSGYEFPATVAKSVYAGPGSYEDTYSGFRYAGEWIRYKSEAYSGGTSSHGRSSDAAVSLDFRGQGFRIYSLQSPFNGIAEVSVDGMKVGDMDLYSLANQPRTLSFAASGFSPENHTLTLTWTGKVSTGAAMDKFNFDFIEIVGGMERGAPVGLKATPEEKQARLDWMEVQGASQYRIYRSLLPDDGFERVAELPAGTLFWNDEGLSNGTLYYYSVSCIDAAGAESPRSSPVSVLPTESMYFGEGKYEENHAGIAYSGIWTEQCDSRYSGGCLRRGYGSGAAAEFPFRGTDIRLYGVKSSFNGKARVWIDGQDAGEVDYGSPVQRIGALVKEISGLPLGNHRVRLEWSGTPEQINLDRIEIGSSSYPPKGLTALPSSSDVTLSWDESDAVDGYNVYRNGVKLNQQLLRSAAFTDKGAAIKTFYAYTITSVKGIFESQPSPSAPVFISDWTAAPAGSFEERDSYIHYSDKWVRWEYDAQASGGSYAEFDGYAGITFNGTGVKVTALKSRVYGKGTIYLDGMLHQVDLEIEERSMPAVIFEVNGLPQGVHTLLFMSDNSISLDRIDIVGQASSLPAPANLAAKGGPAAATLNWTGTPGASAYNLYRSKAGENSYDRVNSTPLKSSPYHDSGLPMGDYEYRMTAIDGSGMESPYSASAGATAVDIAAVGAGVYQDTSAAIKYWGSWTAFSSPSYSGNSAKLGNNAGSSAVIAFEGRAITVRSGNPGTTREGGLYIDGLRVDSGSKSLYQAKGLSPGKHIAKIQSDASSFFLDYVEIVEDPRIPEGVTAFSGSDGIELNWLDAYGAQGYNLYRRSLSEGSYEKLTAASLPTARHAFVDQTAAAEVDYAYQIRSVQGDGSESAPSAEVISRLTSAEFYGGGYVEETHSGMNYVGVWKTGASKSFSGGSQTFSDFKGSAVLFRFTGTGVQLLGTRSKYYGKAEVFIDGESRGIVDEYLPANVEYKAVLADFEGLPYGDHTLKLVWTGIGAVEGLPTNINLDALTVRP